jgi:hypothetical protein
MVELQTVLYNKYVYLFTADRHAKLSTSSSQFSFTMTIPLKAKHSRHFVHAQYTRTKNTTTKAECFPKISYRRAV